MCWWAGESCCRAIPLLLSGQPLQRPFQGRIRQFASQFNQLIPPISTQLPPSGNTAGWIAANLHPYLNSSNLMARVSKLPGQLRCKLAQFGCHRAIIGCKNQRLQLYSMDMAETRKGGGGQLFVKLLQNFKLFCLAGQLPQFLICVEVRI